MNKVDSLNVSAVKLGTLAGLPGRGVSALTLLALAGALGCSAEAPAPIFQQAQPGTGQTASNTGGAPPLTGIATTPGVATVAGTTPTNTNATPTTTTNPTTTSTGAAGAATDTSGAGTAGAAGGTPATTEPDRVQPPTGGGSTPAGGGATTPGTDTTTTPTDTEVETAPPESSDDSAADDGASDDDSAAPAGGEGNALVPTDSLWIAASTNGVGVEGSWYEYADAVSTDIAISAVDGVVCLSGTVAAKEAEDDYDTYGAGMGLNLNDEDEWDGSAYSGFSFTAQLTSDNPVEVRIPIKGLQDTGKEHFVPLKNGSNNISWSDLEQPQWVVDEGSDEAFDESAILALQFAVTTTVDGPNTFEVCISDLVVEE